MKLDRVLMLAAHTARSQAYLQALTRHELQPEQVVLFGEKSNAAPVLPASVTSWQGITLHDPAETLEQTCRKAGWTTMCRASGDVNAPEIAAVIRAASPDLVIYSGYGGQIVGESLLASGPRFLHVHSGWLPDYRGSTTLYYTLLNGEQPGVSALILDCAIDTGPIVARRHYPVPPVGMDLDRFFDHAIRADLLVRVLETYARKGGFDEVEPQNGRDGANYYVIHPVLKHLALLSLDAY